MIKAILTNEILQKILQIERNKDALERVDVPDVISNKLRKNSRKMIQLCFKSFLSSQNKPMRPRISGRQ